jgi:hypothetical protein
MNNHLIIRISLFGIEIGFGNTTQTHPFQNRSMQVWRIFLYNYKIKKVRAVLNVVLLLENEYIIFTMIFF